MKLELELVTAPDERLRQISKDVLLPIGEDMHNLYHGMVESMKLHRGCGLSAIQVGIPLRMFVLDCALLERYDDENYNSDSDTPSRSECFINPNILFTSDECWIEKEGCLSLPETSGNIKRPKNITLEFFDLSGQKHVKDYVGWTAKAAMHEIDHLNGKLVIDYLSPLRREMALKKLKKIKKNT